MESFPRNVSAREAYCGEAVNGLIERHCVSDADDEWDLEGLATELPGYFPTTIDAAKLATLGSTDEMYDLVMSEATTYYEAREEQLGAQVMREVERQVMLRIIDQRWREHLYEMDYLQEGINLRAMGQKDPLTEWQREGYEMFGQLMKGIADDFIRYVMHVQVVKNEPQEPEVQNLQTTSAETEQSSGFASAAASAAADGEIDPEVAASAALPASTKQQTVVKDEWSKTPRNAPCPCGSGKKFKQCHGVDL